MTGFGDARRSTRPVRVMLARELDAEINGAWWPHSASLATELPNLVSVLQQPLGKIIDICLNWSEAQGQLDLDAAGFGSRWASHTVPRRPRLIKVVGRDHEIKLLVIPPKTSPALGVLVMRRAARRPIDGAARRTPAYETADAAVRAALAESARWTRPADPDTSQVVAQGLTST